jgi:protein SCO1
MKAPETLPRSTVDRALLPPSLVWAQEALASWRFPIFMFCMLGFIQLLMLSSFLIPAGDDQLGLFAESFKVWCFGYDPETGRIEQAYVVMLLVNPLVLAAVVTMVWWEPLRQLRAQRPAGLWRPPALALVLTLGLGAGLVAMGPPVEAQTGPLAFPADELRTAYQPPAFTLTNQDGQPVELASLQGRVVLVTAVYATCGYTCPMIMAQTKRVVDALSPEERESLTVIAITLDPRNDTQEALANMARSQEISAPLYNLVTGEPAEVERVLDRLGITREWNEETGQIDHANLFLLIDRGGRIAYRLSLGEQQEPWLVEAIQLLVGEGQPRT